jgi:hypothetical protein
LYAGFLVSCDNFMNFLFFNKLSRSGISHFYYKIVVFRVK